VRPAHSGKRWPLKLVPTPPAQADISPSTYVNQDSRSGQSRPLTSPSKSTERPAIVRQANRGCLAAASTHEFRGRIRHSMFTWNVSGGVSTLFRDEAYRIASKAVRNSLPHSPATRIEVDIHYYKW
jgi:hypothetical protein